MSYEMTLYKSGGYYSCNNHWGTKCTWELMGIQGTGEDGIYLCDECKEELAMLFIKPLLKKLME